MQEEDAAYTKKHYEHDPLSGMILYDVNDAEKCIPLLKEVPYEEYVQLSDRVQVCFHVAGHILGSAMIALAMARS